MRDEEKEYIRLNYDKMSIREMERNIKVGRGVIGRFLKQEGLEIKNNKPLSEMEKEFIFSNYGKGYKFLSKELNRPLSTVKAFCNKNNLKAASFRNYEEVLNEIKENKEEFKGYMCTMSVIEVANTYGVCKKTLYKIMKELNIPQKRESINKFNKSIKIKLNEDYFETIDTSQKAYFLGLIASDGCVYIPKGNKQAIISITLLEEDEYILDFLYNELNADKHPIHTKNNNGKTYSQLQISSNKIANDLKYYGIIPNKTYEGVNIRNIPEKYYCSFLLGYFDGDGSINTDNDCLISSYNVSICGVETAINSIRVMLDYKNMEYIVSEDKRDYDEKCGVFSSVVFVNTTTKYIFLKEIYKNDEIFCLKRKKGMAKKLIYNIEQNITNRKENILAINEYKKYLDAVSDSNI